MTTDEILARMENVHRNATGWTARCPCHDDRRNSLSLSEADGKLLLHCHAGCPTERVIAAIGLTMSDLFVKSNGHRPPAAAQPSPNGHADPLNWLAGYCEVPTTFLKKLPLEARASQLAFRFDPLPTVKLREAGTKTFTWQPAGAACPPLWPLPEATMPETIYIAEGETDAIVLRHIGLGAYAATKGAGSTLTAEHAAELKRRGVKRAAVVYDADDAGRAGAAKLTEALAGAGIEAIVVDLAAAGLVDPLAGTNDVRDAWLTLRDAEALRQRLDAAIAGGLRLPPVLADGEWEPPTPFFQGDVPAFPTEAFPRWLRDYVAAEAIATQTPPDLAGMLVLSALSTAAAKKVAVRVRDGWQEPVNVYTVTALPPGNRKTAVFADVAAPIEEYERSEIERLAPAVAEAESRYRVAKSRLEHTQSQAAKAKPDEAAALTAEASELAREMATMQVPALPRLIVDDCTPERLSTLLRDQGGRLAVLSAEGDVFDLMAGRYSERGGNFGVYLRAHSGDPLRVDRVGRPPEFVKSPALTMGLAVQPEVIRGLVKQPGFRGRGLLARFLYSWPVSTVGHRDVDPPPVPEPTRTAYHAGILALLRLPFGTDDHGDPAPNVLRLHPDAERLLLDFMRWLEPQLGEFGELGTMADWGAKQAGAVVRIAGLLHVAGLCHDPAPWAQPIDAETMRAAVTLGHYLIAHARIAFAEMGADPEIENARCVLDWIERSGVETFTKRDAYRGTRGRFKRVEEMEPALTLLGEHGYIREQPTEERHGPGRKPSPRYEVNPLLLNAQSLNSVHCVHSVQPLSTDNSGHSGHRAGSAFRDTPSIERDDDGLVKSAMAGGLDTMDRMDTINPAIAGGLDTMDRMDRIAAVHDDSDEWEEGVI